MGSTTRFITYISLSLQWSWTKPCRTEEASYVAAENMVCAYLMDELSITRPDSNFGVRLRNEYPELVKMSHQYIGETREIELPDGITPKQFQKRFCTLQISSEDENIDTWQKEMI